MNFLQTLFLCISLIVLTGTDIFATEAPTELEAGAVAKCVEENGGGYPAMMCYGETMQSCIGDSYQNNRMIYCAVQEYMVWDQRLNAAYQAIMKLASFNVKSSLKSAQRSWIEFRDETCSANALIYEGGSHASLAMSVCMGDQTAVRSLQLEQFLEELAPK
ncbi:lysozyme inhibitor LprI family protein [Pseudovibrio sp. Tun.PSC04-5.I4]|uniref:lysozyme inhibitor LprI family protein n=1 Tax=Pseudovibrio sp. Tun.PSC04-5.I4 TaxID=1798213 RepID=UPI0008890185|nr:lysozyme inhibitor LprI family protein [Pseudovibrio sp. Tun.PSC04-5.I4]SDQ22836.1 Uncharacterized conserved protein YecT, DUF1311 family [Pseudovibrio sp. Tun.PSC04-5.I4]